METLYLDGGAPTFLGLTSVVFEPLCVFFVMFYVVAVHAMLDTRQAACIGNGKASILIKKSIDPNKKRPLSK